MAHKVMFLRHWYAPYGVEVMTPPMTMPARCHPECLTEGTATRTRRRARTRLDVTRRHCPEMVLSA